MDRMSGSYHPGDGSSEEQNWRLITDNDATTLTVSPGWNITHSTNTEYVIVGSDKWTAITTGSPNPLQTLLTIIIFSIWRREKTLL
jgi:hypothetical protein